MQTIEQRVDAALARHERVSDELYALTDDEIETCEAALGAKLPAAMKYIGRELARVDLDNQLIADHTGTRVFEWITVWNPGQLHLAVPTLSDPDMYAQEDERTPEWLGWLAQLVPFAPAKGQSLVCLDYAFDTEDPPVVLLDGERTGIAVDGVPALRTYRPVRYLADSFLAFLELDTTDEEQAFDRSKKRITERLIAWHEHRDAILGPPKIPSPTQDDA